MNRRVFLKSSGLALIGSALAPDVFVRMANASTTRGAKVLVAIFQRGALDGLSAIVPYGESAYYAARPNIAIAKNDVLDLDGFFGAHPSLASLMPFWKDRSLAVIHAAGSPDATRSHFDAQDFMESGTPGVKATRDGFFTRALASPRKGSTLRAVSLTSAQPRIFAGSTEVITTASLAQFGVRSAKEEAAFAAMYAGVAKQSFEAARLIQSVSRTSVTAEYPRGPLADSLRQIAQLIKSDVGLEIAFTDVGGWDTHANQPNPLANNLRAFSDAIAAFANDLGSRMSDVVLVTMSEFGRTVRENGNRGTDHGHATVMLALGGGVQGGKVHGGWPGLAREALFEGRDLAMTTDYRDVFAAVLAKHHGVRDFGTVFPKYAPRKLALL